MPGPVFLRGDQVELRPIEDDDAPFLAGGLNDPSVRPTLAQVDPLDEESERAWIEEAREGDQIHLLITADEVPVGTVGLAAVSPVWGSAELGYWVAPSHQGQGYATDAVATMATYAFEERRLHRLRARVVVPNPASERVLEKVGFVEEGIGREAAYVDGEYVDVRWYGLLADDERR